VKLGAFDTRWFFGVGDAAQGLCGGMALSVRDLFEAGLPAPPDTAPFLNGSSRFRQIVRRQVESLDWLQLAVKIGTAGLALLVAFVPRRIDARAAAALGGAVLIALQLTATHWFYLYIVWFVPFVLVVLFAEQRVVATAEERAAEPERELVPA
jgi:hypothetical protein